MLAVVLAAAVLAAAAPAVRAASAGPPAQEKTPPKVVFDIPPISERIEIDGRKNPEMIPQWDVWHAAVRAHGREVGLAHRGVEGALEGRSRAGLRARRRERQELPGLPAARSSSSCPRSRQTKRSSSTKGPRQINLEFRWQVLRLRDRVLARCRPTGANGPEPVRRVPEGRNAGVRSEERARVLSATAVIERRGAQ